MDRTTDTAVFEIIDTTLTDIDTFITTANLYVTDVLGDAGLSDERLEEIERYLTAHFLSLRDQRVQTEKVDVLSVTYQGKTGMYLESTQYGQMAIMLDTSGTLSKIAKDGVAVAASMKSLNLLTTPTV
jgi:hypothetical protein